MATTTAIIKLDLQIDGGQKLAISVGNLKELKDAIKQINAQKITLDPRSPQFQTASNQLKTLQTLYKGLAKDADSAEIQIEQANAALNEQPKAIGYYRQLQAQLVALKNQYKDLSETEAKSQLGQRLGSQINGISSKLKQQDALLGDFQRNVGNYKQSLLGVGDLLTGGLATGGIVVGVSLLKDAMVAGVNQSIKYQQSLSNLSALTGLQGAGLENLNQIARGLQNIEVNGQRIVNTGPDILEALKLVGGARPELLGDAEAMGDVAKNAIILSKASGDDLKSSIEAVTTTLGQFKLAGKDSSTIVNQLAAGAKEGSAEIPQITSALKEFGTVAEISNISTSNSIALTEVLADRQLKGAEAGTQLRNVLSKLASADILPKAAQEQFKRLGIDINILKDSTLPFETRLRELGKAQGDVAALTKIFGLENLQAATIITSGIDRYVALDKAVQGTSEAYKQAGINADNAASKIENIQKGALNSLEQKISDSSTATGILVDGFDLLVNKLDIVGGAFDVVSTSILGPLAGIGRFIVQVKELLGLKTDLSKTPSAPVQDFTLADPLFPDFGRKTLAPFDPVPIDINTSALDSNTQSTNKNTDSKKKNKEEDLGAADSIARLTKRVTELQDALSKAPQSGIVSATQKLVLAEQALARAKAKEAEARNPTPVLTEVQQAEAGLVSLGVDINTPKNEADAKAQLDALATSLAGSVGVTIPVEIDQEQARKDFEIQKYFLDQEDKERAANADKEKQRKEDQQKQNQEFLDIGLQAASQFNSQLAAQETARVDNQLQKQTEAIQKEFDDKRAAAQGNAVIIANLDKQQKEKELQAEKTAARERKQIALKEAVIAYALAAIKAGANVAGQIAAAAAFALGLAAINAQEFFAGGLAKDVTNEQGVVKSANMKPTRHGDNRVAFLKVGERVLTKDNQAAIEQQYGSGIWRNIGAKDPGSIFGARNGSMVNPSYGFGRPILNVSTSLSREDIGLLARANAITSERIAESVKIGMAEGAKYNARQEKALSKTR